MIDYRLALAARSSSGLGAEIIADVLNTIGTFKDARLTWSEELNGYGSLEFSLPDDHASVTRANFALGNRELHLYRDAGAGEVLVWGGKLWQYSMAGREIRFRGFGWYFDLTRRELGNDGDYASQPPPATTKDQFDIVREIVALTQAETGGNLGITMWSAADSGVTRRLAVCAEERRKVSDIIEELAGADNGFDFAVHPNKQLELWFPRRGVTVPTVTLDAADNVSGFSYEEDATELTTQMAGVGDTEECSVPTVYVSTDAGQLATYGLLQDHLDIEDRKDENWIEDQTDEALRVSRVPRLQPKVTMATDLQSVATSPVALEDVEIGDEVDVAASRGAAGGFGRFAQQMRVVRRQVEVRRPGIENITYELDQVVA